MSNYYEKYLKYKGKYVELKNRQRGGYIQNGGYNTMEQLCQKIIFDDMYVLDFDEKFNGERIYDILCKYKTSDIIDAHTDKKYVPHKVIGFYAPLEKNQEFDIINETIVPLTFGMSNVDTYYNADYMGNFYCDKQGISDIIVNMRQDRNYQKKRFRTVEGIYQYGKHIYLTNNEPTIRTDMYTEDANQAFNAMRTDRLSEGLPKMGEQNYSEYHERFKTNLMLVLLCMKFRNKILSTYLARTEYSYLVEISKEEEWGVNFFGSRNNPPTQKGKNLLGKSLMYVRKLVQQRIGTQIYNIMYAGEILDISTPVIIQLLRECGQPILTRSVPMYPPQQLPMYPPQTTKTGMLPNCSKPITDTTGRLVYLYDEATGDCGNTQIQVQFELSKLVNKIINDVYGPNKFNINKIQKIDGTSKKISIHFVSNLEQQYVLHLVQIYLPQRRMNIRINIVSNNILTLEPY